MIADSQQSQTQTKTNGGTSHILPLERAKCSFNVEELEHFLNGGKELTKKRRFIESVVITDPEDYYKKNNFTRDEYIKEHVGDFIRMHKKFAKYNPPRRELFFMLEAGYSGGALSNSHSIFAMTIMGQGNEEQVAYWRPKIMNFEITGSYAQTELGHGSNVRGIQTTATYDVLTEEFVICTPNLQSIKWWPGCLGKIATHVALYAQLILNRKEKGIHVFIMQIRDDNHLPLPGITLGDMGNKMGDLANDTGFMVIDNVRIPRTFLLSKYVTITKEGKYEVVQKVDPKIHYLTMMSMRAIMVSTSGCRLSQACTMAIRYSAVREQGFVDSSAGVSYLSKENQILDYRIQLYRLVKQLSTAYALRFTGMWMTEELSILEAAINSKDPNLSGLKELASTSAGLKSLCTALATNGIEDLRKCCGGNGYLLASGISQLSLDFLWQITAEGDYIILALLTARYLLQCVGKVASGKKLKGIVEYLNVISSNGFSLESIDPLNSHSSISKESFSNLNFLLDLFKFRALKRVIEVGQDFNSQIANEVRFEVAWNNCSNDLLRATYSHCFNFIFSRFVSQIDNCKDNKIKHVLTKLAVFFACSNMTDDNWGDIIDNKYFFYINSTINDLLRDIRPEMIGLVDAFGYPDRVLKSAIGRYDGNVYEALLDSAKKSVLNQKDPFDGYKEYLRPHLNIELLKNGNKPIPIQAKFKKKQTFKEIVQVIWLFS